MSDWRQAVRFGFATGSYAWLKADFLSSQKLVAAILWQKKSIMQVLVANILMRISIVKIVCECFLLWQESRLNYLTLYTKIIGLIGRHIKDVNQGVACGVLESWLANCCKLLFFFGLHWMRVRFALELRGSAWNLFSISEGCWLLAVGAGFRRGFLGMVGGLSSLGCWRRHPEVKTGVDHYDLQTLDICIFPSRINLVLTVGSGWLIPQGLGIADCYWGCLMGLVLVARA